MERTEVLDMMSSLKLYGIADETTATSIPMIRNDRLTCAP